MLDYRHVTLTSVDSKRKMALVGGRAELACPGLKEQRVETLTRTQSRPVTAM